MPPHPPVLASSLRGYVCRSCLSKLQKFQNPRPLWLARNIRNNNGPPRTKHHKDDGKVSSSVKFSEPVIKYWEQTASGERTEKGQEENGLLEKLEASIKELEAEIGDTSLLEKQDAERDPLEEEEDDDNVEGDLEAHISKKMNLPSGMESRMAELKAQMWRLENNPDLDNLSEEDRMMIRNEVLNGVLDNASDGQNPPYAYEESPNATAPKPVPSVHEEVESDVQDPEADSEAESTMVSLEEYSDPYRRKLVTYLNSSLLICQRQLKDNNLDDAEQKAAWNCYSKCRKFLLNKPETVPDKTWSLLWDIFEQPGIKNFGRLEHIFRLGLDMEQVGIKLSPTQHVLFIESQFVVGYPEKAIAKWEDDASYLEKDESIVNDYLMLGVRMYAQNGNGDKALDTVANYFSKSVGPPDFRLLIPVIRGYLSAQSPEHNERAWRVYKQLEFYLGKTITMEDFDAATSLFLDAGLPEKALDVFTHMMLEGEVPRTSMSRRQRDIDQHPGVGLIDRVKNPESSGTLATQSSETLTTLPQLLNNKFFFGKWIKKLIGEGQLDVAKQVFHLMGARSICPDARHLNGLIGAFYRDGSSDKQILAQDLARRMIAARLDFVYMREMTYSGLASGVRAVSSENKTGIKSPFQTPRATIETFSILMDHYKRYSRHHLVPKLLERMQMAKIPPNTHFMNQLIMTKMTSPQAPWAWDTYRTMFTEKKVNPDFDTFTFFWELMRKAASSTANWKVQGFVNCRELFSEMVQRSEVLCRKETMPRAVYDLIILSFSLSLDQAGTAIALRALQRWFNLYPDENTARTIIHQLSKLGLRDRSGRHKRRLNPKRPATKIRMAEVSKIISTFQQERVDALLEQGINFDDLGEEAKQEESLLLLTNVLRFVAQSRLDGGTYGDIKTPEELSYIAAEQMGVKDCNPWPVADV